MPAKAQFLVKPPRAKIVLHWSISTAWAALKEQRFVEDSHLEILFSRSCFSDFDVRVSEFSTLDRLTRSFQGDQVGVIMQVHQGFYLKISL